MLQRRPSGNKLVESAAKTQEGFQTAGNSTQVTLNEIAVREFHDALSRDDEMAFAVAAIMALTAVIKRSTAATLMGMSKELEDAAQALQRWGFARSAEGARGPGRVGNPHTAICVPTNFRCTPFATPNGNTYCMRTHYLAG